MILQALCDYYDRVRAQGNDELPQPGYSVEQISYEVLLSRDGKVVQVNNICDTSGKKPRPRSMSVPQPEKRTAGIKPNFLWDKTSYVFGVSANSNRADKEHEEFRRFHLAVLAREHDEGLHALAAFLKTWKAEDFVPPMFPDEMKDSNVVFRLDGERGHIHDRPAAQALRETLLSPKEDDGSARKVGSVEAMCLVSGFVSPVAKLHPAIKGVNGAQSSGASIVSFNQKAFTSYGKEQGENAPVSDARARAYTTALNHLLRWGGDNRQRLSIGDTTVVFWAQADTPDEGVAAEGLLADLIAPPDDAQEAARIREVLDEVCKGRALNEIDPKLQPGTRMFILGLAPNASRLSVRFWMVDRLDQLTKHIVQHEQDLSLLPLPWRSRPGAARLVLATVPSHGGSMPKMDDAISNIVGAMMKSILTGRCYPRSLLANTIMRIRADTGMSPSLMGLRAAICKAVLVRERRLLQHDSSEEIPVSLDKQSRQPGYLLGRLFAVLESAQRAALGGQVNATIRDRYYGAASATPASIYPMLLRNVQNHLAKLRKERPGQAVNLEKLIQEIVSGLPERFPVSLNMESQGRFAIGYYHQAQAQFARREDADPNETEDTYQDNTQGVHE